MRFAITQDGLGMACVDDSRQRTHGGDIAFERAFCVSASGRKAPLKNSTSSTFFASKSCKRWFSCSKSFPRFPCQADLLRPLSNRFNCARHAYS